MKPNRSAVAVCLALPCIAASMVIASAARSATPSNQAEAAAQRTDNTGIGGAGAFIRASHVNGPFGAGGPFAARGGAGAFIPASAINRPKGSSTATTSTPPTTNTTVVACVVDVSDWPLGTLPDDTSAAFGPAVLDACVEALRDWPLGALPDGPNAVFGT